MKRLLIFLLMSLAGFKAGAQARDRYYIYGQSHWVDSVFATLSTEEKIGQLFMVAAFTTREKYNIEEVQSLVQKYHIGGVIFFKGGPVREAVATNRLQEKSKIPLLVGMDAEWGLSMRLDSTMNYGYQMSWGALRDDSLTYKASQQIAWECKRLGIHINFAPVIDINNNPLNPVIHMRSFGENKKEVARRGIMYTKGMQDLHVLAVAKHFPGHGNTDVDSHLDLPILKQSVPEMDTLELYPFKQLFNAGVGGVMTAHLHIPAYDSAKNIGASLSAKVTTRLLREKMGFTGIAFSDALNMKGVSKYYSPGELELKALLAGNDILLYSENIPKAIEVIKTALDSNCLSMEVLDQHVKTILQLKKWVGLDTCKYVEYPHLYEDLNSGKAKLLKQKLAEKAVTLVRNKDNFLPLKNIENKRIASVAIGTQFFTPFQEMVGMYCRPGAFSISMYAKDSVWMRLRDTLRSYDIAIVSLHNLSNRYTSTYGLTERAIDFVNTLKKAMPTVIVSFGSPYALSRFPDSKYVVCGYQDDIAYQQASAQLVFGALTSDGRLPVTGSEEYKYNSGLLTKDHLRMHYTQPEELGIDAEKLSGIDTITLDAINKGAFPGCEILVAKNGEVIYYKSFGKPTYESKTPVDRTDIYDLASVTKVAATTLCLMKLSESGKIKINETLGSYLPELKNTNKANLKLKDILAHQAGLTAWIPFFKYTLTLDGICDDHYCYAPNEHYSQRVAERLYIDKTYRDSILAIIAASSVEQRGHYRYSDLGFIYMQQVLERVTGHPLDSLADSLFYHPLGLSTMGYKPRRSFPLNRIAPTENDTLFRKQLIHGDVHDPAAAMMGGVSGHAGLFSNANDLAILMQMLLNGGTYAGKRYLQTATIQQWTASAFETNRRALGWDKPEPNLKINGPTSTLVSPQTFGHTGFTGTSVWADPKYNLVFVFLSNRVYPTADNHKLVDMNVRTRIQDVIYQAIGVGKVEQGKGK